MELKAYALRNYHGMTTLLLRKLETAKEVRDVLISELRYRSEKIPKPIGLLFLQKLMILKSSANVLRCISSFCE